MFRSVFVAVLMLVCVSAIVYSQEPTPAYNFQFPCKNQGDWKVNCNDFWGTCNLPNKWHTGEDVPALASAPVYSPANGIVKHTKNRTGYGNVIIIEHLAGSEYVCSLMGHLRSRDLQVSVGQTVTIGDLLGYLGDSSENGGWVSHFHFAINKGKYRGDYYPGCSSGSWWYSGYTTCESDKGLWYDPSDFVAAHSQSSLVGLWPGGWNTEGSSDTIKKAHDDAGGEAAVGVPGDNGGGKYVHLYYSADGSVYVIIQDFYKTSTNEWFAIIYNPTMRQAFLLKGGFRWHYMNVIDGPKVLKAPVCNEKIYTDTAGLFGPTGIIYIIQSFATGKSLIWTDRADVPAEYRQVRLVETPTDFQAAIVVDGVGGSPEPIEPVPPPIIDPNTPLGPITVRGKVTPLLYGIPINGFALGETYSLTLMITNNTNIPVWNFRGTFFPVNRSDYIVSQEQFAYASTVYPGQSVLVGEFTMQITDAESKYIFAIGGQVNYRSNGDYTEDCSAKFEVAARPVISVVSVSLCDLAHYESDIFPAMPEERIEGTFLYWEGIVQNLGTVDSAPCEVAVIINGQVFQATIGSIPAGQKTQWNTVELEEGWPVGTYDYAVILDYGDALRETDETNNRVLGRFTVVPKVLPEWNIEGISLSKPQPVVGDSVELRVIVGNPTTIITPEVSLAGAICRERMGIWRELATVTIPELLPLDSFEAVFKTPLLELPVAHIAVFTVDQSRQITEADEANNETAFGFAVTAPKITTLFTENFETLDGRGCPKNWWGQRATVVKDNYFGTGNSVLFNPRRNYFILCYQGYIAIPSQSRSIILEFDAAMIRHVASNIQVNTYEYDANKKMISATTRKFLGATSTGRQQIIWFANATTCYVKIGFFTNSRPEHGADLDCRLDNLKLTAK